MPRHSMKTVLTIAGSDPTGEAGVQADLRTFWHFKVRGLSAITALTAQDGETLEDLMVAPAKLVSKQLKCLARTNEFHAVKIGMLGEAATVTVVAAFFKAHEPPSVVLDPVFNSSSGRPLLDEEGLESLHALFPYVKLITPNLYEAARITGLKGVFNVDKMEEAARMIHELGPDCVLVKGGHLRGDPIDVLFNGRRFYYFESRRIMGKNLHGTGCILSSAIAAGLAKGRTVKKAVEEARAHLMGIIESR